MELRKFINKLLENSKSTYDFGCVMLYFTFPQMLDLHKMIKPEDIYVEEGDNTYGLEDKPHCTLLYGLHDDVSVDEIKSIVDQFKFSSCKIYQPSQFQKENYDVFKFSVMGGPIIDVNKELTKLPHTTDYPNYEPHMTIGYLQPGTAQKYIDLFNKEGINEFDLIPQSIIYTTSNDEKIKIPINTENSVPVTTTNLRNPLR